MPASYLKARDVLQNWERDRYRISAGNVRTSCVGNSSCKRAVSKKDERTEGVPGQVQEPGEQAGAGAARQVSG